MCSDQTFRELYRSKAHPLPPSFTYLFPGPLLYVSERRRLYSRHAPIVHMYVQRVAQGDSGAATMQLGEQLSAGGFQFYN